MKLAPSARSVQPRDHRWLADRYVQVRHQAVRQGIDPAVVSSFIYTQPGDPYSPKVLTDMQRSLASEKAVGEDAVERDSLPTFRVKVQSRAGGANVPRATARVTFWGALAMALTAGIGKLFGTVV